MFGSEVVLSDFTPLPVSYEERFISEEDEERITENITKNFLKTALEHPDAEFYFFPPHSICYLDSMVRLMHLGMQLETQKLTAHHLLAEDDVYVYVFSDRLDIIGNLDNYTDTLHYSDGINTEILNCLRAGKQELTSESVDNYYDEIWSLYETFDFSHYGLGER